MNAQPATSPDHDVVVVGAGPVGLTAALAVRAAGMPVTVLEAGAADRRRPGSRAIFYHRQTLEHWNSIAEGLGWEIARTGITWTTKRTFFRGELVYDRTYPPADGSVLPPFTSLAQIDTERLLLDACKAAGVEFAWQHEITAVDADAHGARLQTANGDSLRAQHVIAADGARSGVRGALRIDMSGSRSENHFVIVDIGEDPDRPMPPARVFHYEHPAVQGRHVLLVPFAGGWRADLQCRTTDDPSDYDDEDGVRKWVGQVLPERYADRVRWVSTYQFLQVVADRFADEFRRVLLVGEAAHMFAPFGARGLNSGVADSLAAARAIVGAREAADETTAHAAIDEFARSRRAAAEYNRDAAGIALRHMQARGLAIRAKRWVAVRRARRGQRAGAWLDSAPYGPRARDRDADLIY